MITTRPVFNEQKRYIPTYRLSSSLALYKIFIFKTIITAREFSSKRFLTRNYNTVSAG